MLVLLERLGKGSGTRPATHFGTASQTASTAGGEQTDRTSRSTHRASFSSMVLLSFKTQTSHFRKTPTRGQLGRGRSETGPQRLSRNGQPVGQPQPVSKPFRSLQLAHCIRGGGNFGPTGCWSIQRKTEFRNKASARASERGHWTCSQSRGYWSWTRTDRADYRSSWCW
jgi:hypothetical protein